MNSSKLIYRLFSQPDEMLEWLAGPWEGHWRLFDPVHHDFWEVKVGLNFQEIAPSGEEGPQKADGQSAQLRREWSDPRFVVEAGLVAQTQVRLPGGASEEVRVPEEIGLAAMRHDRAGRRQNSSVGHQWFFVWREGEQKLLAPLEIGADMFQAKTFRPGPYEFVVYGYDEDEFEIMAYRQVSPAGGTPMKIIYFNGRLRRRRKKNRWWWPFS